MRFAVLFCSILALAGLQAQESPTPTLSPTPSSTPSPSASPPRSVFLRFALPPLDGTISLGIYDPAGKLVRVLHREDEVGDFTAGHDALETAWDGTDEQGNSLPNGKYRARGYVVGDLKVEGMNHFFNDWVTDEHSPHILDLSQLWMADGGLRVTAALAGGEEISFFCDQASGAIIKVIPKERGIHCDQAYAFPNLIRPEDCAIGRDGTTWYIDGLDGSGPREVKQFSSSNELLRRLFYAADEPQPILIEAAPAEEKIFLVEKNEHGQRLRALSLVQTTTEGAEAVSDWQTHFEKRIVAHQNFMLENGKPVPSAADSPAPPPKITQKLRPDPLQNDKPGKVELAIGFDQDGSFLQTTDGLPLRTISDNPNLRRALPDRPNDSTIDVFQDDGAVVEQFRISNLTEMIAFDCGDFELK